MSVELRKNSLKIYNKIENSSPFLLLYFCRLATFSRLGHLFAATNGNIIQIYSSVTFDMMYTLKGHNGRVSRYIRQPLINFWEWPRKFPNTFTCFIIIWCMLNSTIVWSEIQEEKGGRLCAGTQTRSRKKINR